jgi:DNA-directed RNA polymerase specialized sigma24 family protein
MLNTWVSHFRRRDERPSAGAPDLPAPQDVALRVVVRDALGSLPDRERAVLVLVLYDDLSEVQVAQVLDCAIGTVKSTMSRAMAKLRQDPGLAELMQREMPAAGRSATPAEPRAS